MSVVYDSPRTLNFQEQPIASARPEFELTEAAGTGKGTGFRRPQQMSSNAFNDSDGNRSLLIDINDRTDDSYNVMEDSALSAPLMSKRT